MHTGRPGTVVIDCETDDLDAAASFWAQALGRSRTRLTNPSDANYRQLQRFCVVPPQRDDFDVAADTWEDP